MAGSGGANAVQIAIRSGWLEPTAISDAMVLSAAANSIGLLSRQPESRLYDATLYGLDWLSPQ